MAGFADIHAQVNESVASSQSDNLENESQGDRTPQDSPDQRQASHESETQEERVNPDLERIERFMFQGKEYTPKELGTLLAREQEQTKAFTQKMQALAEERKAFESSRTANQKYDDALGIDLQKVRENPNLAQEFIRTYPESYHRHLRAVLGSTSNSQEQTGSSSPQIPVELMSEVQQLRTYVQAQEVAKVEATIEKDLARVMTEFKHANRKEVLADVWEFHNSLASDPVTGKKPPVPPEIWAKAAEASHNDRVEWAKNYQRDLQQQQKQANLKARDVGSGGGTPGSGGPKKFDPKKGFGALNRDVLGHFTKS